MYYKILELYSGIGGMHCAWNDSGLPGEIIAAVDINTVANEVYHHNFSNTKLIGKNIQSITPKQIKDMDVNTILMSPPCQPFTRNGKFMDDNDPRTNSFLYLINILNQLDNIEFILMENVKGFECSTVRNIYVGKLKECHFEYQEFLLCPSSIGIPNSRLRYYCVARRRSTLWHFKRKDEIIEHFPSDHIQPYPIEKILEATVDDKFLVPDKILQRLSVLDVCYRNSTRSCCFTKAYTHYADGTGSVFTEASPESVEILKKSSALHNDNKDIKESVKDLKLRYLTPKEILTLMAFPSYYSFPENTTMKQCYRLIGNSVNVKIISEIIKTLFDK